MKKRDSLLVILGILFISFNLRAPITAVGPIKSLIQAEYGLSQAASGFITTLPLLAAVGPTLIGSISDATGSFTLPVIIFIGLIAALALCGLAAGADRTVAE